MLAAPATTGVILGLSGPAAVFAVMAVATTVSAVLVSGLARREHARRTPPADPDASVRNELLAGFRAVREEPRIRLLVGLLGAEAVALGALDVVFVVLALDLLALGSSGAGHLNAAFGAGGVIGVVATAALVGRRHLVPPLAAGVVIWAGAFFVLGVQGSTAAAFALLVAAGAGRTVIDVAGRTLLQRSVPGDLLSRVFGVLEALSMAGMAVGSLATPVLVAVGGGRAAVIGVGAILIAFVVFSGRQLWSIDANAVVPVVELALLRSMDIFALLPAPTLETPGRQPRQSRGARRYPGGRAGRDRRPLLRHRLRAGQRRQGRQPVATLSRGEGFGEIALLRSIPRTATCTAETPAVLYALNKEPFLAALTGHGQPEHAAADQQVRQRLAELDLA